jgi:predicted esterase
MRYASIFLATAMLVFGCSSSSGPGTGSGGSGTSSAGSGGGGASGAGGRGGSAGGGGNVAGAGGGSAGAGGGNQGPGRVDSGASGARDSGRADARPDARRPDVGPSRDGARDVAGGGSSAARQTARPRGMPYANNGYYEYLPPGYGDGNKRPLLMFWHGIGENGDGSPAQLPRLLLHGPPKIIRNNQWSAEYPFIVLSVQHPGGGCPSATELRDFTEFAMARYDVDPAKVFLTGLSCGGRGGFEYLGQFKGERVLAAALIAADSNVAFNAAGCSLLNDVALWVFHGTNDNAANDTAGMAKFMACPQPRKDARYELQQGANHPQSWERVYDNPSKLDEVLTWMLAQTRGPAR